MSAPPAFRTACLWLPTAVTATLLVVLSLGGDSVTAALRYERALVQEGEWWRWLSASLVHAGWPHLGINLAGLALAGLTVGDYLKTGRYALSFAASALAVTIGLWLWSPGVHWYLGASGVLHGLFVAGALAAAARRQAAGTVILALVALKLAWEQVLGPLPGTAETAGVPVIVDAHLYGAAGGLVATMLAATYGHLARLLPGRKPTDG
jgi:rhomboid family GlyGly-CTERM serine protease